MSDVFQEVDEDIRRREMEDMWRRFGPMAIGIAVIAIAISSAWIFWQNQKEADLAAAGDQMLVGIEQLLDGDSHGAEETFAAIVESAPGGYRALALFQQAAAQRLDGHLAEAIVIYDGLAVNETLNDDFRDLARLFSGYAAIESPLLGYPDVEMRVASVGEGLGPWRYHALEVLGFAAYSSGQLDAATTHYRQITDDGAAPIGPAARADEMLNMIESANRSDAG